MIIFYDITRKNIRVHNLNWPRIPDHRYKILIIEDSGSGKTNALLNLISHQPNIDKIYLYAKDLYEAKYQLLINKHESVDLMICNDSKAFIGCSNGMHDIYENIKQYDPNQECFIYRI